MKFFLPFILIFLFFSIVNGQNTARIARLQDSLSFLKDDTPRVNTLRVLGVLYYGIKTDSAVYFAKKGLELAQRIKWTKGIAQNSLNLGTYLIYVTQYDSSIYYSSMALAAAKIVGEKNRIALIYVNRGTAYTETHQYEKAIADISNAMRIAEETGNKDRQARACQSMVELYMYQDNNDAAIPWAEKALKLGKELNDIAQQGVAEMSLGGLYALKKRLPEAESLLLDAMQKLNKVNRPDVIVECTISLSDLYMQSKKPQKAVAVLQTGLHNAHDLKLIDRESSVDYSLGRSYTMLEDFTNALTSYRNGYELVKGKNEFQKNQALNMQGIAETNAKLGNFKEAYENFSKSVVLKDSFTRIIQNDRLMKLQTQFETDRKEKEIELLKKDKDLGKSELQKQQAIKAGAFILSGLLILIGFLVINRNRAVQQAKRLVEIEKLRNNIARDLHDDIGSTLSSININSKMALTHAGEESVARIQLEKINKNSISMMENMSDIVWAINPAHDAVQSLIIKMKEFLAEILEPINISYTINETEDLKQLVLDVKKRKEIYLVFKEAVNNAAKYSRCKNIDVIISGNKKEILLQVKDDGTGFYQNLVKPGNGLNNMQQRAVAMNGTIKIESVKESGTTVSLNIPMT